MFIPPGRMARLLVGRILKRSELLALPNLSYMTDWTIYTICRRKLDQKDIQQHPSTEINPSYARAGPKGLDVSSRDSDTRGL